MVFVMIAMVVFMANSPLENMFFPVLGNIQVCASLDCVCPGDECAHVHARSLRRH